MKSREFTNAKSHVSKHKDLDRKKGESPAIAKRKRSAHIQDELADDFGEILGDSFHGFDDDYYYDEDDNY